MIRTYPMKIVKRYDGNPIITKEDIPFPCNTVFNAGAVKHRGEYILLLRVETLEGRSVLVIARSKDGYRFEVEEEPALAPSTEEPFRRYEEKGVEDPRITLLDGKYYIFYTAYSSYGPRIGLAVTRDFEDFKRLGFVSQPPNKDAVLFPKKFKGMYARLDRPTAPEAMGIWISYSKDLIYWGRSEMVMEPRPGFWDSLKIGAGAPPIETDEGWLEIYHGVKTTAAGSIYRLGAALLDREDPSKVVGRSFIPILSPSELYERTGDVPNVVFCCGAILESNLSEVKIYYGAADTSICVGSASLKDLVESCHPPR